jgi:hypothetical protein
MVNLLKRGYGKTPIFDAFGPACSVHVSSDYYISLLFMQSYFTFIYFFSMHHN